MDGNEQPWCCSSEFLSILAIAWSVFFGCFVDCFCCMCLLLCFWFRKHLHSSIAVSIPETPRWAPAPSRLLVLRGFQISKIKQTANRLTACYLHYKIYQMVVLVINSSFFWFCKETPKQQPLPGPSDGECPLEQVDARAPAPCQTGWVAGDKTRAWHRVILWFLFLGAGPFEFLEELDMRSGILENRRRVLFSCRRPSTQPQLMGGKKS